MQPVMILAIRMKNILGLTLMRKNICNKKVKEYKFGKALNEFWSDEMNFDDPNEFDK